MSECNGVFMVLLRNLEVPKQNADANAADRSYLSITLKMILH